jgi:hypothetical protein
MAKWQGTFMVDRLSKAEAFLGQRYIEVHCVSDRYEDAESEFSFVTMASEQPRIGQQLRVTVEFDHG